MVGEFLVKFFSDQAAGRATQDVTEQIDYELRSLLDSGAAAFPSDLGYISAISQLHLGYISARSRLDLG